MIRAYFHESNWTSSCIDEISRYPDNTLLLKTKGNLEDIDIFWNYESDEELFAIICLAKKAKVKRLYMPYIPHARMDRVKDKDDTFTLKYFAEVINSLEFETVYVTDPHSSVSEALIDNLTIFKSSSYVEFVLKMIGDVDLIFYPDEGSVKRYSDSISMPYISASKKRDWKTGQILGLDIIGNKEDIKDKTILIVDDICSRGGTFYHSAKKLKECGAGKIYLYVTHCENTILDGELLTSGLIEKVYTTNSIFTKEHERIEVLNNE